MTKLEEWRKAGNLSKEQQKEIWDQMNGTERMTAWKEYAEAQKKQAEKPTPKSESDQLFENVMNGTDPESDIGKTLISMKNHGYFDVFKETKTVDEYGYVHVRREKV